MTDAAPDARLFRFLRAYGADFSRWPDKADDAKAALLKNPDFRRAWDGERRLDRRLSAGRQALDVELADLGAVARIGRSLLRRTGGPLAGLPWRQVAAAVVVAGMLGGALDLVLEPQPAEPADVAMIDPLANYIDAGGE
jgi:hypothetical protein